MAIKDYGKIHYVKSRNISTAVDPVEYYWGPLEPINKIEFSTVITGKSTSLDFIDEYAFLEPEVDLNDILNHFRK